MNIVIFKAGRMTGPYDRETVRGMLLRGEISEHDLAQPEGAEVWVPLRRLFPPAKPAARWEVALTKAREAAEKYWDALHREPLQVGLASLLVGCVLLVLSRYTFVIFVPALAAAVFAGALLVTQQRIAIGLLLCVSSIVVPGLFLLASRENPNRGLPFPLFAEPSIESVVPPAGPAKPTPPRVHSGLALPQPVKPTPAPRPSPPI